MAIGSGRKTLRKVVAECQKGKGVRAGRRDIHRGQLRLGGRHGDRASGGIFAREGSGEQIVLLGDVSQQQIVRGAIIILAVALARKGPRT